MTMTPQEADTLRQIVRRHRWTLEELTVDQKQQEANALTSGSANAMYAYLEKQFGSARAVIAQASALIIHRRARRKTLAR